MARDDVVGGDPAALPVEGLSYTEASRELDDIVAFFEGRDVDVDQLVGRLERATAIVDELDRRLRRTRAQVEELVPRLAEATGDGPRGASEVPDSRPTPPEVPDSRPMPPEVPDRAQEADRPGRAGGATVGEGAGASEDGARPPSASTGAETPGLF